MEQVNDFDTKTDLTWVAERNEIIRHTDPDLFRGPQGVDAPVFFAAIDIVDVAHLLDRARNGDDEIKLVGETTIRDIPTYELRFDYTVSVDPKIARRLKSDPVERFSRLIYVDKERFLPVRIVEQVAGGASMTDYFDIQALPRTPENEKLLEMSPHPGAKVRVEGRI